MVLSFHQALIKYRPDQERDDHGRFTDEGGGVYAERKPKGGKKPKSLAGAYERRFGHAPPKSMSQAAMRRWIDSEWKTAPGQGKDKATRAVWAREQRLREIERERTRQAEYERRRDQYEAEYRAEQAAEAVRRAEAAAEELRKYPQKGQVDAFKVAVDNAISTLTSAPYITYKPDDPLWTKLLHITGQVVYSVAFGATVGTLVNPGAGVAGSVVMLGTYVYSQWRANRAFRLEQENERRGMRGSS